MSNQPTFKPPPFFYPVEVDLANPNATFRQNVKEGNHYYVRFEVTPELWKLFEEPDPGLQLKGVLYRVKQDASDATPADLEKAAKPKREKKPKPPKGEHGRYWQEMIKRGAFNSHELLEVLGTDGSDPAAVKGLFIDSMKVTSRTFISPQMFEAWAASYHLDNLITISRQAEVEAHA